MANFFKGILRSFTGSPYGDLGGPVTGLQNEKGKLVVSIEKGKCIAWTAGMDDVELSKETVKRVEFINSNVQVDDFIGNKINTVDIYSIEMTNGKVGTLRLVKSTKQKVLDLIISEKTESNTLLSSDNKPEGKSLEWFTSEAGLEAYRKYVTTRNYMREKTYKEEFGKQNKDYNFYMYLSIYHEGETLPSLYFDALVKALNVQQLSLVGTHEAFINIMNAMASPLIINEDGEPEASDDAMPPMLMLSVEKNPLLYFVKNFNVFEIKDDDLGSTHDKYVLYIEAMYFIGSHWSRTTIEENKWLFDKDTYLNDIGTVRKRLSFYKKCLEVSGDAEYFEKYIAQ